MFRLREAFADNGGRGGSSRASRASRGSRLAGNVNQSRPASSRLAGNTNTSRVPTSRRRTSRLAGNV